MTKTTDKLAQLSTKVLTSSLTFFKEESKKFKSQGEFFTELIKRYKNPPKAAGNEKEVQALTDEINSLKELLSQNEKLRTDANAEVERLKALPPQEKEVQVEKQLTENQFLLTFTPEIAASVLPAFSEIVGKYSSPEEAVVALLENFRNPKVIEKEKEVIKEVPVPLTENQVIFTFLPEVKTNSRKCRPFMLHDRIITTKAPDDQMNEFLNHAVKYFLRHKYDHITNPL
jgi:hypothetical protein